MRKAISSVLVLSLTCWIALVPAWAEPVELEQAWAFAGDYRDSGRLAFSPDGSLFIDLRIKGENSGAFFRQYSGGDGGLRFTYEKTLNDVWTEVTASALSPDGRYLAMGFYNGSLRLIDTASGKTLCSLKRNQAAIKALAFKRDGSILATSSDDAPLALWLVASDASGKTGLGEYLKVKLNLNQLALGFLEWRADGLIVGAGQTRGTMFDFFVVDPEALPDFVKTSGRMVVDGPKVDALALSPDGRSIALPLWGTRGQGPFAIRIIDIASNKTTSELAGLEVGAQTLAFERDGSSLLWSGFDGNVGRWNLADGGRSTVGEGIIYPINALALYPEGDSFLAGHSDGSIWRGSLEPTKPWELLAMPLGRGEYSPDGSSIAFPADNRRLVILSSDRGRALRFLDLREEIKDYESEALDMVYSPDGSTIAMSRTDRLVHLIAADTGKLIRSLGPLEASARKLVWSKDGKLIFTANLRDDDSSRISAWDVSSGARIASIAEPKAVYDEKTRKRSTAVGMGFDPRSGLAAEACVKDIYIYDPAGGKIVKTLKEKDKAVESIVGLDFIPGAGMLASLNLTKTGSSLTLWDTAKWKVVRSFEVHTAYVKAMIPSPDGKKIAYWGDSGFVQVCVLASGADVFKAYAPGNGKIVDVAFSPDGGQILVACPDGSHRAYMVPQEPR